MSQIQVEDKIEIRAPASLVWGILTRPDRYAEWVSNTDAVNKVTDEEVVEGTTYEESNKILARWRNRSTWRVAELEPERRIVHEAEDLPMANAMRVVSTLEPSEDGEKVTCTHAWDFDSKLGPAAKAFTPVVRRDIEATLENLKSLAEREAGNAEEEEEG